MNQDRKGEFRFRSHSSFMGTGADLFAVIGFQRTGTNILREILTTHEQIAVIGEVLLPSPDPTFALGSPLVGEVYPLDNFYRELPPGGLRSMSPREAELLLDRYFAYVHDKIRYHSIKGAKGRCRFIGVNIKYNQLRESTPANWDPAAPPFLLGYFNSRGTTLIHSIRTNVIHCALSVIISAQRNLWNNYEDAAIDCSYRIDIDECLAYARMFVHDHDSFLKFAKDITLVECCYENLCEDIARAGADGEIPDSPGPLRDIAEVLGVPFRFHYDGRLRKAINVPYSRLVSNWDDLLLALEQSEFSAFATTLADC